MSTDGEQKRFGRERLGNRTVDRQERGARLELDRELRDELASSGQEACDLGPHAAVERLHGGSKRLFAKAYRLAIAPQLERNDREPT